MAERTDTYLWRIIAVIVIVLVASIFAFPVKNWWNQRNENGTGAVANSYINETYHLYFSYPTSYMLDERAVNRFSNEELFVNLVGPLGTADYTIENVYVDVFLNPDDYSSRQWVFGDGSSMFPLAEGEPFTTTYVAGEPALRFVWDEDGEVQNMSTVVAHGGYVYVFTALYRGDTEQALNALRRILDTVAFDVSL